MKLLIWLILVTVSCLFAQGPYNCPNGWELNEKGYCVASKPLQEISEPLECGWGTREMYSPESQVYYCEDYEESKPQSPMYPNDESIMIAPPYDQLPSITERSNLFTKMGYAKVTQLTTLAAWAGMNLVFINTQSYGAMKATSIVGAIIWTGAKIAEISITFDLADAQ